MSVTYIGILVLLISSFSKSMGIEISSEQITSFLLVGGQILGALIAFWGRWRAGGIRWFGGRT